MRHSVKATELAINEIPGVCGGYPVIGRTRIPVRTVIELLRQGASIEELGEMWPHITREHIQLALDYYGQHPERVNEDIERNQRAWNEITSRPWPA